MSGKPGDGRVGPSLKVLMKKLETAERPGERAKLLRRIGEIQLSKGDLKDAENSYSKAVDLVKDGDPEPHGLAIADLAAVVTRRGDLDRAEGLSNDAMKVLAHHSVNIRSRAKAILQLGTVYLMKGENRRALEQLDRALALFERSNDPMGVARTCNAIGNIYLLRSQFGKALAYYNRSTKIFEELGDKESSMGTMHNVGTAKRDQGLFFDALRIFEEVKGYFHEHGLKRHEAMTYSNIGHTYLALMRWDDALHQYEVSRAMCLDIGETWIDSYNSFSRSEAYLGKGEVHNADENLKGCFDALMRSGSNEIKGRSLRVRGMIKAEVGNIDGAIEDFTCADATLKSGEFEIYRARLFIEWAKAEAFRKDLDAARERFTSAMMIYRDLKLPLMERALKNTMRHYLDGEER